MCRLYGFHANERTKIECELVRSQNALLAQHCESSEKQKNADGWGIACYAEKRIPDLVRHKTAFGETCFSHQAASMYASTVLAHVRFATVGTAGPLNSHPFCYDNWTFAHNGTIPGFELLASQLDDESGCLQNSRLGSTDSEQFFLWLLNRLCHDRIDLNAPNAISIAQSLGTSVCELDRRCREIVPEQTPKLTFVMTNGDLLFGCSWNEPLHFLQRNEIQDCEICGISHVQHDATKKYRAAVFASEPFTDEAWSPMVDKSLIVVPPDFRIERIVLTEGVAP